MINLLVRASINAYSCIATKLFTNYCVHIFLIFQAIITNTNTVWLHGYTRSSNKFCRFLGVGYRGKEFDLHSFPKNNLGYTVCWWIKLRPLDNIITHSMTKINYYLNLEIRYIYTATLYMVSGFREYIARLTI